MPAKRSHRSLEIDLNVYIRAGKLSDVSRLLQDGVDPNASDDKSNNFQAALTALCNAIMAAAHTISDSRSKMADVQCVLFPDKPPADLKAERQRALDIINLLLSKGADPNLRTLTRTPLSVAVTQGDSEVVQLLLNAGANPAGECWSPMSRLSRPKGTVAFYCNAIHTAAEKGFAEIVQLLLSAGADPSARDHNGKTALQTAARKGHGHIIEMLEPVTPAKVTARHKKKKTT